MVGMRSWDVIPWLINEGSIASVNIREQAVPRIMLNDILLATDAFWPQYRQCQASAPVTPNMAACRFIMRCGPSHFIANLMSAGERNGRRWTANTILVTANEDLQVSPFHDPVLEDSAAPNGSA